MTRIQVYDPFAPRAFDDLFQGFFRSVGADRGGARNYRSFRLDVNEDEKSYVVVADLPGVTKEDVQVTIDADQVTIAAEVKRETETKEGEQRVHVERRTGSFFRSFKLPVDIDESASDARLDNGVLTLRLAKKQPQTARKLTIQ